jgi:DNA-binding transcriptional regulator YdaS (Cro superfamily)
LRKTVQHAALLRVCELLGGISKAAQSLSVSTLKVAHWLDGDEAIPEDVFLGAVQILIEHSRFR